MSARQALPLACLAVSDPRAQWRDILIDSAGHAVAVERVRRGRLCRNPGRAPGLTGRVTVTVPVSTLEPPASPASRARGVTPGPGAWGTGIRAAVLRAARRAADRAAEARAADTVAGGCAHTSAGPAYRPAPRLRDYVTARDQTCRQPYCCQPAWRADLDHTRPYDRGGPTCSCNLGGYCRTHHRVKQEPGWHVTQPRPGHFQITTPPAAPTTSTPTPIPPEPPGQVPAARLPGRRWA